MLLFSFNTSHSYFKSRKQTLTNLCSWWMAWFFTRRKSFTAIDIKYLQIGGRVPDWVRVRLFKSWPHALVNNYLVTPVLLLEPPSLLYWPATGRSDGSVVRSEGRCCLGGCVVQYPIACLGACLTPPLSYTDYQKQSETGNIPVELFCYGIPDLSSDKKRALSRVHQHHLHVSASTENFA